MLGSVVLLVVTMVGAFFSGTEFFPQMNTGEIAITVEIPEEYTEEQTFEAEEAD